MKYLLLIAVFGLTGCGNTAMSQLSDKELRKRHAECRMSVNLSAAEIQVCNNIQRECQRRAQQGNFVC